MADVPQGVFTWPGVAQVLRGEMTLLQGTRPSVCTLEILPQDPTAITLDGTLNLVFGNVLIEFVDCRVDRASFDYTLEGMVWRFSIWDRRWKWRFAAPVSGSWNLRFPTVQIGAGQPQIGTVDPASLKTPQQLALLCLLAMGENAVDVSGLPNDSLPEVLWDVTNSAQALEDLAEQLGCRVVLGIDDVVRVVRQGIGADLPADGVLRESDVADPPDPPDSILLVGGKVRYQVDFLVEAVGLETNGLVVQINGLSYKPATGWTSEADLDFMLDVAGWEADPTLPPKLQQFLTIGRINPRELAKQTVYRWYRIISGAQGTTMATVPGWRGNPGTRLSGLYQILPVEDRQVVGWYDPTDANNFHSLDAIVYGVFADQQLGVVATAAVPPFTSFNSQPNSACYYDFELDAERGIVKFAQPVYAYNADGTIGPATLYLRTAVSVRDPKTEAWERYLYQYVLPGAQHGTGPMVLRREEIVLNFVPTYNADYSLKSLYDNRADCDAEAAYAVAAVLAQFQDPKARDVTYVGLVPVSPDGAVTQVTWTVGPAGATTRVAQNTEWHPVIPSFRERLLYSRIGRQSAEIRQLQSQVRGR